MHLQALNAIVKTAHLGDEGGTLGVLSMHVHDLARQSDTIAQETIGVLRTLEEQPLNVGAAAGSDDPGQQRITRGLEDIQKIDTELRAAADGSLAPCQPPAGTAGRSTHPAGVPHRARVECWPLLRGTGGTRPAVTPPASPLRPRPKGWNCSAGRYTMASEVEVHRRLLQGEGEPVLAVEPWPRLPTPLTWETTSNSSETYMPIEIHSSDPALPMAIAGTADVYSAVELKDALLAYLQQAPEPALDLGGLDGCDTVGLQLLLSARKSARQNGAELLIDPLPLAVAEVCVRLGVDLGGCGAGPEERGMSKTILTADDSASMREMIAFTLTNAGYRVIQANGRRGGPQAHQRSTRGHAHHRSQHAEYGWH